MLTTSRFDAALNHISRRIRIQVLCGVIGLPCPLFLNQFDAAPVDHQQFAGVFPDDDQSRPTRMRFHPKGNLHYSNLKLIELG